LFDLLIFSFVDNPFVKRIRKNLIKIIIYISPLVIFFIYIKVNNLFSYWLLHHSLPEMYLKDVLGMNIYDLLYNFFYKIFSYSYKRLFSDPQYFFYLILIVVNIIYFIVKTFNFFRIIKKQDELLLLLISFCSLVFLYNTLHNFSIFKFATGNIIGLIILIKVIKDIKNIDNKMIIITSLFFFSLFSFELIKNNSNLLYVGYQTRIDSVKNNSFKYFKNQKWEADTWNNLIFLDQNVSKINTICNIKNSTNLTTDGFYSLILRKYLITDQKLPWFENKDQGYMNKFYNAFFNKFDNTFYIRIQEQIRNNNIVIVANKENFPIIEIQGHKIFLGTNMKYIDIPYSYNHKKKIIIFPSNCFF
jgi:hypothetical protein